MCAILDRGAGTGDRQAIERIGIKTVFDPLQRFDELRVADGVADAQAGERMRFR